jgi:hypothetical protein
VVLFANEDYVRIADELANLGSDDERLKALARDFHSRAAAFGLELHHDGLPDGTLRGSYPLEFYYPEIEGGAEVFANIAENGVEFTFFPKDGDVLDENEYPHDKGRLVWLLLGAMNSALFEAAASPKS